MPISWCFLARIRSVAIAAVAIASLVPALPSAAHAQSVAEFYKGKTVDLLIGYSGGGGYDVYARLLARHMGRHIPGNPTIVPRNMPGAGSLRARQLALQRRAEGRHRVWHHRARHAASIRCSGSRRRKFDPTKFLWLGSMNNEVSVCVTWHTVRHHQVRRRC